MKRSHALPPPAVADPDGQALEEPTREHQTLWFALAHKGLVSVVLVPTDVGQAVGPLAAALSRVGQRLGDNPVTAIVGEVIDYEFVKRASDIIAMTGKTPHKRPGASPLEVIVTVRPVTAAPLGLAVIQAADAAVLCIRMGRSRLSSVRETVALIGREKVAGWVVVD
jgi:hypothetical protein